MRVADPIDQSGIFWLPSNEGEHVPGTLTIDETGRISLHLFGLPDDTPHVSDGPSLNPFAARYNKFPMHRRIHGTIQNRAVTLDRCIPSVPRRMSFGRGISEISYLVSRAYVGVVRFDADEVPSFTRVNVSFHGLLEWINLSGIRFESDGHDLASGRFTLTLDPPESIPVSLQSGVELSLNISHYSSHSLAPSEVTVVESAYLSLEAPDSVALDELLAVAKAFQRLLSLAVGQPCDMTSISAFAPDVTIDGQKIPINVYTSEPSRARATRDVSWHRMLFTFPDIQSRFSDLIIEWFDNVSRLEPALDLYDAMTMGAYQQPDGHFLATAQAIEALHRRLFPHSQQMGDNEFDTLIATLIAAIPNKRRDWLTARLQFANEPSFRQRVREMVDQFADYYGTKKEIQAFVTEVVDARNHFTHLPANGDRDQINIRTLIRAQKKLDVLFQLHLLHQLGFDCESLDSIARDRLLPKLEIEFFC